MNRKGQMTVGTIIIVIMGVIAGLVLLGAIFNQQSVMTQKTTTTDESINFATARYGAYAVNSSVTFTLANGYTSTEWQYLECPLTNIVVTNASGAVATVTTDYTVNTSTGVLALKNSLFWNTTTAGSNVSLVDYTYCQDGYNKDASSRSVAGLIGLFGALGLLGFIVYYGVKEFL